MKFGLMFQLQTPKPLDADPWGAHDEFDIYLEYTLDVASRAQRDE